MVCMVMEIGLTIANLQTVNAPNLEMDFRANGTFGIIWKGFITIPGRRALLAAVLLPRHLPALFTKVCHQSAKLRVVPRLKARSEWSQLPTRSPFLKLVRCLHLRASSGNLWTNCGTKKRQLSRQDWTLWTLMTHSRLNRLTLTMLFFKPLEWKFVVMRRVNLLISDCMHGWSSRMPRVYYDYTEWF